MATGRAVVVGAGLAGLAAGGALSRAGWQVTVCERAPALEPVGAAISLWPNALRALDTLGIGDAVRSRAAFEGGTGFRRPDGTWLGRTDIDQALRDRFGDPLVVLARCELTDLLAGLLPAGALRTGATVRKVEPGRPDEPGSARAVDETGGTLEADLVVAADGIGSTVRASLFPDLPGPRYAGYTSWRLIAAAPPGEAIEGSETWGPGGQRFAVIPMAGDRVYCYATATVPPGLDAPDELAELRTRFGGWHRPIPAILADLAPGQVLHHDIYELGKLPPAYAAGRIALLGDAAHAMTPELGQGGCVGIEDAVTLAALAGRSADLGPGLARALARYTELRRPRTARIARRSRLAVRLTQATGPVGTRARDAVGRLTTHVPARLFVRTLDGVVDWRPPEW